MRLFTRLIVCTAVAAVLSAVLFHAADALFGDNTSVFGAGRQLVLEARRTDALRTRSEMVARSLTTKRDIIEQLLAGRLQLREAILQFQKANELVENFDLDLIPAYRTPADLQGVGRQVYTWAANSVVSWPAGKAERFLAKLERDYQKLLEGAKTEDLYEVRPMGMQANDRTETTSLGW